MVETRMETRQSFRIVGCKTWISGEKNEEFGLFWAECRTSGILDQLAAIRGDGPGKEANGMFIGLSAVERDPANRRFHFYIAVESNAAIRKIGIETVLVPASTWAVFRNKGRIPDALIEAEMYAFKDWLPASSYVHAKAPEMEVYPPSDPEPDLICEFWLPVRPA